MRDIIYLGIIGILLWILFYEYKKNVNASKKLYKWSSKTGGLYEYNSATKEYRRIFSDGDLGKIGRLEKGRILNEDGSESILE